MQISTLHWRHILPIVQTVLYCGLSFWFANERHSSDSTEWEPTPPTIDSQGSVGVGWNVKSCWDCPPPPSKQLAIAINLPAILLSLSILLPASLLLPEVPSVATKATIGIFVAILWYAVGWWIDDRRGLAPPLRWRPAIRHQWILVATGLIFCVPLFALLVFGLTLAIIRQEVPRQLVIACGVLAWSGWLSCVSALHAARLHRRSGSERSHYLPDPH